MSKVFGYPTFDASGEMVLTTYDGDYAAMLMDVRVYKMKAGETRKFCRAGEEIAVLLLNGKMSFAWGGTGEIRFPEGRVHRGPLVRPCRFRRGDRRDGGGRNGDLVQCTKNDRPFPSKLYAPEDAPGSIPPRASSATWLTAGSIPFSITISAPSPTWSWGRY